MNAVYASLMLVRCAKNKCLFIATDNAEFVYAMMHELAIDLGEKPEEIIAYLRKGRRIQNVARDYRIGAYARDMQTFPPQQALDRDMRCGEK